MIRAALPVAFALLAATPAAAQAPDTLTIGEVLAAARTRDPRLAQLALERARSSLRLRTISADRLPSVRISAQAQHQSEVTSLGGSLPGDPPVAFPRPSRDTYDARLDVRQPLFDPTIGPRRALERAGLAESEARLEVTLHALRIEAIEAFFAAALMQERVSAIEATIAGLEAALEMAGARVREGTALRSEESGLRAELLRRRQDADEARAERSAALEIVGELTGIAIASDAVLDAQHASDGAVPDSIARPELQLFARSRDRLLMRERAFAAADLPRLTAFGRAGYGRPGLNLLGAEFGGWWLGGLQLEWSPRLWGVERRERELVRLESDIVETEEAAFRASVARATARDSAAMGRLARALKLDEEIVRLREEVERETRLRFVEGVVTSAELVDRNSDVLAARITRASHAIELGRARARYLTLLGQEVD